jgi:hypothetical protein
MQRQQKITPHEMRESGPTWLIVYCGDYKCTHSVTIKLPAAGLMTFGCRIWSEGLRPTAAPMSGRCLSRRVWDLIPKGNPLGPVQRASLAVIKQRQCGDEIRVPRTGASTARLIISIWIDSFELQITLAVGLANSFPKPRHAVTHLGKS